MLQINKYGDQSKCIHDTFFKHYCFFCVNSTVNEVMEILFSNYIIE